MSRRAPSHLANFDSASAFARSTAAFLAGEDFPALGAGRIAEPFAPLVNLMPKWLRERFYAVSGASEAILRRSAGRVDVEEAADWIASLYPNETYPAVIVGAPNGCVPHLAAALGAPFLPQTLLVPVLAPRSDPDDPASGIDKMREAARALGEANPDIVVHQQFDPNQDRLVLRHMALLRFKWRALPRAYARFLETRLAPGAPILVTQCEDEWPVTRVGPRHLFQFGGHGGLAPEDYARGGPEIAQYLARYGVEREGWEAPPVHEQASEAEWGFDAALLPEIADKARRGGHPLVRLVYRDPEEPSPFVAELYRRWYAQRGIPADRLLVESFIAHEPAWTLRTGSVPFWMAFNTRASATSLERYLDAAEPYDEIRLMLFNHGTIGVGLAEPDRWRALLARARVTGAFCGVDPDEYPLDFGALGRYRAALEEDVSERHPIPEPLGLPAIAAFARERPDLLGEARLEGSDEAVRERRLP